MVVIKGAFSNPAQETANNRAYINKLMKGGGNLTKQVVLYSNNLSTKDEYNDALQTKVSNLQDELKTFKAEISTQKKSSQPDGARVIIKGRG